MAAISFKGRHFQHSERHDPAIRSLVSHTPSVTDEKLMQEPGFPVDHSTINRWGLHYSQLESALRLKKKWVGKWWRMDETYIKVKGQWKYYYRAIDFLLASTRNAQAALRFLKKAIKQNGTPSLVNIDQSGANHAGLKHLTETLKKVSKSVSANT